MAVNDYNTSTKPWLCDHLEVDVETTKVFQKAINFNNSIIHYSFNNFDPDQIANLHLTFPSQRKIKIVLYKKI